MYDPPIPYELWMKRHRYPLVKWRQIKEDSELRHLPYKKRAKEIREKNSK